MVEVTGKTGLVALFDILGYQQMLLANDVASTARIVVDVLGEVPNHVVSALFEDQGLEPAGDLEAWSEMEPYFENVVREEMGWLLFSDSILVSLPIDLDDEISLWGTKVVAFVQVCSFLLRRMFDVGLPLRGGISFGEFFIHDTFFSGRPIIEAYQHSESLELSGCVLAPSAAHLYRQMKQYAIDQDSEGSIRRMLDDLCVDYLIPMKPDRVETGSMVNWVNLPMRFFEGLPSDLRQYVFSSFVAHNKDVVPAVQPKIDNTEAFVRKIVENVEPRPWPAMPPMLTEAFLHVKSEERVR
jgi:hypothetical protein